MTRTATTLTIPGTDTTLVLVPVPVSVRPSGRVREWGLEAHVEGHEPVTLLREPGDETAATAGRLAAFAASDYGQAWALSILAWDPSMIGVVPSIAERAEADSPVDAMAELADHEDLVAESFGLIQAVVDARAAQDREALDEALYAARVAGYSLDDLARVIGVGRRSTVHYRVARHAEAIGQPMPTGRATLTLR
jgi:hypothetical protein